MGTASGGGADTMVIPAATRRLSTFDSDGAAARLASPGKSRSRKAAKFVNREIDHFQQPTIHRLGKTLKLATVHATSMSLMDTKNSRSPGSPRFAEVVEQRGDAPEHLVRSRY